MIRARAMLRRRGRFVAAALLALSVGAARAEVKNRIVATVDPFDVGYETPVIIGLKVHRGQMEAVAERLSLLMRQDRAERTMTLHFESAA